MARTGVVSAEIRSRIAAAVPVPGGVPLDEVVRRWLGGESLQVMAKECSITARGLQKQIKRWMLAGCGDQAYFDLVTEALVNRIADADERLEGARDPVQVAKYREMARFARMDFERRRPALYGQKQEVKHTSGPPAFTVVLLEKASGGTPVASALPAPSGPAVVEGEVIEEGESDGIREGREG